jgi:hypothetical protein
VFVRGRPFFVFRVKEWSTFDPASRRWSRVPGKVRYLRTSCVRPPTKRPPDSTRFYERRRIDRLQATMKL